MCVGKFWYDGKVGSLKKKLGIKQALYKVFLPVLHDICPPLLSLSQPRLSIYLHESWITTLIVYIYILDQI